VVTRESAFLCDAGFSFSAADTAANIHRALEHGVGGAEANPAATGGPGAGRKSDADGAADGCARSLNYILLTHSHFDHAAGAPVIARAFPDAKIVASRHAAEVFTRPGARRAIAEMDAAAAKNAGREAGEDFTSELRVDIRAKGGDVIQTSDEKVRVYDTPGHTNCSLSYYFEKADLLASSESSGFQFAGMVLPAFLTSYRDSQDAIALVERLAPEHLLLPHAGLISGAEAKAYPSRVREESEKQAYFILSRHRAGMSEEDIVTEYISEHFDKHIRDTGLQPRESFAANAHVLVPRLIAENDNGGIHET
jgi:glyoxylase-like metal-dependent hydrolase (beta-lactamase superfamily II)